MKTQVIQLEDHDDFISTRDKMGWSQTGRILLVWPTRGRILRRRLDLLLLLRHAQSLGVQLALMTSDSEVRYQAGKLGIPVFSSVRKAQNSRWKRPVYHRAITLDSRQESSLREKLASLPRPVRSTKLLSPALRLGLFTIGVLAVLSIAAVLLPGAEIRLTPKTELQDITLTVRASEAAEKINLSGIVPLKPIRIIVQGSDRLSTTGTAMVPQDYAKGRALFTNLTDHEVAIPAGTVINTLDSKNRYATDRPGEVPAGPGQTVMIPITALSPGRSANLAAEKLQAIEGGLGVDLTVTNPQPTSGGSDVSSPAPTSRDRAKLRARLTSALKATALTEILSSLKDGDRLLTFEPTLVRTLEESFSPSQDQPGSELRLDLRQEYQAAGISQDDLKALTQAILDANLPKGYVALPESLQVADLTQPEWQDKGNALWQVRANRLIQARPDKDQATNLAIGRSPFRARQNLMAVFPLIKVPEIKLSPGWWPFLPFLPFRIAVQSG